MPVYLFIMLCAGAYLFGSIPFGLIYSKARGVDIRAVGSGNIGATNVSRQFGFFGGFVPVFLLDAIKGATPVIVVRIFGVQGMEGDLQELAMIIAGILALVGHIFPIYLKFKGGKGVATTLGVFLSIAPVHTLIAVAVFGLVYAITRVVAVGSIFIAISLPLLIAFFRPEWETLSIYTLIMSILAGVLIVIRHISNIQKLADDWRKKHPKKSGE